MNFSGRRSHSAINLNGKLLIFGGYNGRTKEHKNDLWLLDPEVRFFMGKEIIYYSYLGSSGGKEMQLMSERLNVKSSFHLLVPLYEVSNDQYNWDKLL